MPKTQFILQLLREGRAWMTLLLPLIAGTIGLHLPQPSYMKNKNES